MTSPRPTVALLFFQRVLGVFATHAEVLEFPDHPFYIASMFQPHVGASEGEPIHPLIREFATAIGSGTPSVASEP